jgi:hypothetical protein
MLDGAIANDRTQVGAQLLIRGGEVAAGSSITLKLHERLTFVSICKRRDAGATRPGRGADLMVNRSPPCGRFCLGYSRCWL